MARPAPRCRASRRERTAVRMRLPRVALVWALGAAAVAAALPGCAVIRVRRAGDPDLFQAWRASAVTACDLSPRTGQTLRRLDLDQVYPRDPAGAVARLHAAAADDPRPDLLFALAEINYQRGREAERGGRCDAIGFYYLSNGYAYHYLFDDYHPHGDPAGGEW